MFKWWREKLSGFITPKVKPLSFFHKEESLQELRNRKLLTCFLNNHYINEMEKQNFESDGLKDITLYLKWKYELDYCKVVDIYHLYDQNKDIVTFEFCKFGLEKRISIEDPELHEIIKYIKHITDLEIFKILEDTIRNYVNEMEKQNMEIKELKEEHTKSESSSEKNVIKDLKRELIKKNNAKT